MLPVLDLDPTRRSAGAIATLAVLRDQPFEPHQAGMAEQIRPDLALFKWRQVDAVDAPGEQPRNGREEQRSAKIPQLDFACLIFVLWRPKQIIGAQ